MNRAILILAAGLISSPALAQAPQLRRPAPPQGIPQAPGNLADSRDQLTRFDLDFPGGSPLDLVHAMEKAMGRAVNAIIPADASRVQIPALKLRAVTVPDLFDALEQASTKTVTYVTGFTDYGGFGGGPSGPRRETLQQTQVSYGFARAPGAPLSDDSVWYFYDRTKLSLPQTTKVCRFWQLGPYLEHYNIDDITTAIQTGYRLLGEPAPSINFHKDTKLLIAVGESANLNLIDAALRELTPPPSKAPPPPGVPGPKPAKSSEPPLKPAEPPPNN